MEIGLEVWGDDFRRIEAACRHAEELGIDLFTYGESPHSLNLECWTVLAALARTTERIRLGPVIANVVPTFRSTFLLARHVEALESIAPGRVELRTGVGAAAHHARPWWSPQGIVYPAYDERFADLEAALALWEERWATARPAPLTLAATGGRALALAARHAQVWETSFCTPQEYEARRARFEQVLEVAAPGRVVTRCLEIDGFVATSEEGVGSVVEAARSNRNAEPVDRIFERALVGTPDQIAERLDRLASVGVERVLVALHDPLDLDAITALARGAGALQELRARR